MQIFPGIEGQRPSPNVTSVRVMLLTDRPEGESAQRLAGYGSLVEIEDDVNSAIAAVLDDTMGYDLFVMDCDGIKLIAANPEIIHTEGEQSSSEGCLSVGKVPAVVSRPMMARLKAQNEKGEWFEADAEGYAARCFLHETDHCDGKLFIDHLPKMRRDMVVKRFKKEKNWK